MNGIINNFSNKFMQGPKKVATYMSEMKNFTNSEILAKSTHMGEINLDWGH